MSVALAVFLGCTATSRGATFEGKPLDAGDDSAGPDAAATDAGATSDGAPDALAARDATEPADATAADVINRYDVVPADACDAASGRACAPRASGCAAAERCNNGLDDDCDGTADEGCPCVPGTIQTCFLGPPGGRNIGVCRDGTQRCTGIGEFGTLEACIHGIGPAAETCDGVDNNCDGCVDEGLCCDGPADGLCRATLTAGVVAPSMSTCFVDEVVSRNNPGTLTYRCRGGEASAAFGPNTFAGSYMGGVLDVRLTTTFRYTDGCDWVSTQRITGDPRAPTLQYDYQEAIAPGQRGCATACGATATVSVRALP